MHNVMNRSYIIDELKAMELLFSLSAGRATCKLTRKLCIELKRFSALRVHDNK